MNPIHGQRPLSPPHPLLLRQRISERKWILTQRSLLPAILAIWPVMGQAQFTFTNNNGTIAITGYTGPGGAVTIPDSINGLPVTAVEDFAFSGIGSMTSLSIPATVTNIGIDAFA